MFVGLLSLQTTRISTASTDTTMDGGGGIMDDQDSADVEMEEAAGGEPG